MTKPAPFTPADADLRALPYMPLHVAKLRDSDLAAECEPEACWYALLLWSASWHQLPAGSLPTNDAVLCKLIGLGRDLKTWRRHKAEALRGWVECSDGRLYHPVVAAEVKTAWKVRLEHKWRSECARIKKANQRNGTETPCPTFEEFVAGLQPAQSSQGTLAFVPEDTKDCPQGQAEKSLGTTPLTEGKGTEGKGRDNNIISNDTEAAEDLLALTARIAAAAGVSVIQPTKLTRAMDVVKAWKADEVPVDLILDVIAKRLADMRADETVSSLSYFDSPIRKALALKGNRHAKPSGPPPALKRKEKPTERLEQVRTNLKRAIGARAYEGWLAPEVAAISLNGSSATVTSPSAFMADWNRSHFAEHLRQAAGVQDVWFEVEQ